MSCISIRLTNRPYFTRCDSYEVLVTSGFSVSVSYTNCSGGISSKIISQSDGLKKLCVFKGTIPNVVVNGQTTYDLKDVGECTDSNSTFTDEDLYVDLFPDFDLRETKQVTELTEFDKLKFNIVLGFDISDTPNNRRIFKTFFNPNILDNNFDAVEVDVLVGSHYYNDNSLFPTNCVAGKITVELRLSLSHWGIQSKSLFLHTLDYGSFTVTENYHKTVNESAEFSTDSTETFRFPYVDYGRVLRDKEDATGISRSNAYIVPVEHWRPWFFLKDVLRLAFCKIDWDLNFPLLDTEFGSKLILYMIDKNFGRYDQRSIRRIIENEYYSEINQSSFMAFAFQHGSAGLLELNQFLFNGSDPNYTWNKDAFTVERCGEFRITGKLIFDIGDNDGTPNVRVVVGRIHPDTVDLIQHTYTSVLGDELLIDPIKEWTFTNVVGEINIDLDILGASLTSIDRLGIAVFKGYNATNVEFKQGSSIRLTPTRAYVKYGDYVEAKEYINKDLNLLKLIKGLAHNFNLKFYTDFSTRTVNIYSPYDANWFGNDCEGFYIEETFEDIIDRIDPESKDVETPNKLEPRYNIISYKESNNLHIKDKSLKNPLWSIEHDLGEEFTDGEPNELKNVLLEPIINDVLPQTHIPSIKVEGEHTFDIGVIMGIWVGNRVQSIDGSRKTLLKYNGYNDLQGALIPTVTQYVFDNVNIGIQHNVDNDIYEKWDMNLTFGVNDEFNQIKPDYTLYELCYRRWFLEQLNNLGINYLVCFKNKQFLEWSFRSYYKIMHEGREIIARSSEVRDYNFCSDNLTPVTFIPTRQLSDSCALLPNNTGNPQVLCKKLSRDPMHVRQWK